jgi:hypothetical protein
MLTALVPREDAALLAVVVSLIFAVLCGYIKIFPYWMKSLSYSWWATEALFDKVS